MIIRKTFKFEAAHRLINSYTTRCQGIHGHSYKVEVLIEGELNFADGMVIDFTYLKETAGRFIDRFDHSLILHKHDVLLRRSFPESGLSLLNPRWILTPYHPTAEAMASHFFACLAVLVPLPHRLVAVRVHETETGYAEALGDCLNMEEGDVTYSPEILEEAAR